DRGLSGVFCMASHGEATFAELAQAIVDELGLGGRMRINQVSADKVSAKEKVRRPARGVMLNERLTDLGLDRQRPWRDALSEYLSGPYFNRLFSELR
ncbi:MAG: NAD(P)-dependent oxidoreductase, partial [Rhodospirillales bacterium]|nr:NAD(P)-dependent oxidoreductase [Rhodospirillales bacterium]